MSVPVASVTFRSRLHSANHDDMTVPVPPLLGLCGIVHTVSMSLHPRLRTCCRLISRTETLVENSSNQDLRGTKRSHLLQQLIGCTSGRKRRLSCSLQTLDLKYCTVEIWFESGCCYCSPSYHGVLHVCQIVRVCWYSS